MPALPPAVIVMVFKNPVVTAPPAPRTSITLAIAVADPTSVTKVIGTLPGREPLDTAKIPACEIKHLL